MGIEMDSKGDKMTSKINNLFEKLLQDRKLDLEELSWADYVCINLDLILYQNEGLLNKAFALLIRFHSQRRSLFDLLRSVQMLESEEAIDTLRTIEEKLTSLRRMAQNSEFWLGQTDRESVMTAMKAIEIFNYLSNLLVVQQRDGVFDDEEQALKVHADQNPFLMVEENKSSRGNSRDSSNSMSNTFIII